MKITTGTQILTTPRKFNIAPENKPSQKESSLPTIIFQGLCQISGVYLAILLVTISWDGDFYNPFKGWKGDQPN